MPETFFTGHNGQNKNIFRQPDNKNSNNQEKTDRGIFRFTLNLILQIHRCTSLTIKMVVLTVALGIVTWLSIDILKTNQLEKVFRLQLTNWLETKAMEDRLGFDNYVKAHLHSAKLFISQQKFSDYIKRQNWSDSDDIEVKQFRHSPSWFPRSSVLRTFIQPRFALLLDANGSLREIFYRASSAPPAALLNPSQQLILKSEGQNFMTKINGHPYLVASKRYIDSQRRVSAILMLASPIDDIFLNAAIGSFDSGHEVALITQEEKVTIIRSSNPLEIPAGTPIEELATDYIITGKEFFDYGASEDPVRLMSFVSTKKVAELIQSVASSERRYRAIGLPIFIGFVTVLMLWITRRIKKLTLRISEFSERVLGGQRTNMQRGDQLYQLEKRFHRLTDEVIDARDNLKREADERLLLEKKNMSVNQKIKQLDLLQSVTQAVGIGVVKKTEDGMTAVNKQMAQFMNSCGELSEFDVYEGEDTELTLHDCQGSKKIFHISSPDIFQKDEDILLVRDITKEKEQTEALEHQALHDGLTGLPNRILLRDRIEQAINISERDSKSFALVMMDLDRFKDINDTLGHHTGDLVLKEVGQRLISVLRKSDTVARLGGDEFSVVMPAIAPENAKKLCRKILDILEEPFIISDHNLYIGASIGIVFSPEDGLDASTLLQRSDVAMYIAKNTQCGLSTYKEELDDHSLENLVIMGELKRAIDNQQLYLNYQPKISCKNETVIGAEALVRWNHPVHGFIPPDKFIPIAEHTGLIKPLTIWVLDTALGQCVEWQATETEMNINISVNMSARSLLDLEFPDEVDALLKKWGLDPGVLELEITESAVMEDPEYALKVLTRLDTLGIKLSIDDFGTGYSSLGYLKKLPVDVIKIDRSFVMHMMHDKSDATIVRSTIDLAHNLGLEVIAEGVETQEIQDELGAMGCDEAQGYHICRPVSGEEFIEWFNQRKSKIQD